MSFLVDTGADKTVLMPLDGGRLGVDYDALPHRLQTVGIGGISNAYVARAILALD